MPVRPAKLLLWKFILVFVSQQCIYLYDVHSFVRGFPDRIDARER